MRHLLFVLGIAIMAGCSSGRKTTGNIVTGDIKQLRFINEYIAPNDIQLKGTTIGGLSGIDYDKAREDRKSVV